MQGIVAEVSNRLARIAATLSQVSPLRAIEPTLLTPVQAAVDLGISKSQVFKFIRDGRLDTVRLGASRRIPRAAVAELVDQLSNRHTDG